MRALRIAASVVVLLAAACSSPAPPGPPAVAVHPVDPSFVHGTDRGDTDRLAATVVTDVQAYWSAQFPAVFDKSWHDLDGGFFSVDTNGKGAPPPCSASPQDVEGNAYYCATVDTIAWDRAALLPVLREHYGDASVAVVLAHEMGHAVQQRSGVDIGGSEHPVRIEAMADCYSGSFVRWVTDGHAPHLHVDAAQLDGALRALIGFRDPVGTASTSSDAHGTAFDRVSAFQDGFQRGPRSCAAVTEEDLTARTPHESAEALEDILRADAPNAFFADYVTRRGGHWTPPAVRASDDPAASCTANAHPVAFCARPRTVVADRPGLDGVRHDLGDHAAATLLASRFALAALDELGRPTTAADAERRTACLTGAYTGWLGRDEARLSPGDLDEAVDVVLDSDDVSRDARGRSDLTGFDRITAFRTGAVGGPDACG
ncbi:neutral zinc metallopeptidase [Saccharopolyspora rosea]|uniref:Peptidase n=1 Tax=Saccharopolyspora rosea TaxID=524884 RepID=A0ABW3FTJ3_9PSEU|nr:peptidase [Saccharopolyspora rosea]